MLFDVERKQKEKQSFNSKVNDTAHVRNSKLVKGANPSRQRAQRQQPRHWRYRFSYFFELWLLVIKCHNSFKALKPALSAACACKSCQRIWSFPLFR